MRVQFVTLGARCQHKTAANRGKYLSFPLRWTVRRNALEKLARKKGLTHFNMLPVLTTSPTIEEDLVNR